MMNILSGNSPTCRQGKQKTALLAAAALILYFVFACVPTYPLIFHMKTHHFHPDLSQACDSILVMSEAFHATNRDLPGWGKERTYFYGYPFGVYLKAPYSLSRPLLEVLSRFFGPVSAHNILVLFMLTAAGASMFFLAYYLSGNFLASFLAGSFFAFSPWEVSRVTAHITLAGIFCLPLTVLLNINL